MKPSILKSTFGLAAVLVVIQVVPAFAQSKCDAGKLKEYGKKVSCLSKVDSTAAKKGLEPDTAKADKCIQKFTEKCAKAESQGDCTGDVLDCAALGAEAETCRDSAAAPTCADFGGVDVGGFCWFLGALGAHCNATCAAAGGLTYDVATGDYAGSGGTDQQCVDVLDALGVAAGPLLTTDTCVVGAGCADEPGIVSRIRCTVPPTDSTASFPGVNRACACQLP
jgi:hypothetical protein